MMHRLLQMHTHVSNASGPVAILRNGLVQICDGNHCAAMILDFLYEKAMLQQEAGNPSPYVTTNLSYLREMISGLFDNASIASALALLGSLFYTDPNDTTTNRLDEEVYYKFPVNIAAVNDALIILRGETPQSRIIIETPIEDNPETREEIVSKPLKKVPDVSHNLRIEAKRVAFHRRRAEVIGLSASLTLAQWLSTLEHFHWHCAYCVDGEYQVFEHYTPLFHGGGTTMYNCVPSCNSCNSRKRDDHPSMFEPRFPQETITHVKQYLTQVWESEVNDAS